MNYEKELIYQEYVQRENEILHAPYDPEFRFYSAIKEGNVALVKELCKEPLMDKKGLGKLSGNALQNFKYHFVISRCDFIFIVIILFYAWNKNFPN